MVPPVVAVVEVKMKEVRMPSRIYSTIMLFVALMCTCLPASSEIRLPQGDFYKNVDDMTVKVLGGAITIRRTWHKGEWHFNRAWNRISGQIPNKKPVILSAGSGPSAPPPEEYVSRNDLKFDFSGESRTSISHINGGEGYHYEAIYLPERYHNERFLRIGDLPNIAGETANYYGEMTIPRQRWEDTSGNWIEYYEWEIQSYGNRTGVIANFIYDADGVLAGIKDRSGNQVVWYEYDADGKLRFVKNSNNEQVEYRYTGDLLTEAVDIRGHAVQLC